MSVRRFLKNFLKRKENNKITYLVKTKYGEKMKFLKSFYHLILVLGLYSTLLISSFFLVVFINSGQTQNESIKEQLPAYQENNLKFFEGYIKDRKVNLLIEFKDTFTKEEQIVYAYYYFDSYSLSVEMIVIEEENNHVITVNLNGIAVYK